MNKVHNSFLISPKNASFITGNCLGARGQQNGIFYFSTQVYSRVRNKHSPTLINFLTFFQGLRPYSGLHRTYFSSINIRYKWGYAYSFRQIFQGLCLFKGLRLFQTLEYMIKKSRDKRGASDTDFFREIQSRIQRQNLRTKVLIQHFDKVLIDD